MTTFDDREKAFEDKYKHDQELQFRVEVRRNKLLGLWAAELLGKSDAQAYASEVISATSRSRATPTWCARSWAICRTPASRCRSTGCARRWRSASPKPRSR
jgi:hypothetical protein